MSKVTIEAVLLVEDNPGDARLLREMFNEIGPPISEWTHVECMKDAETYLAERAPDVILLDLGLPDAQGLDAVRRAHAAAPRLSLVVVSGLDDESIAVQAMREGAQDYLVKGQIEPRGLLRALRSAIERKTIEERLLAEKERAQATLDCIGDAVICTDISGNITFLNIVAEKMTGWTQGEAVGRPMAEAFCVVDANSRKTAAPALDRSMQRNLTGYLPLNCLLIRRDGSEICIEDSASEIQDQQGRAIGRVVLMRDVSSGRAVTEQIAHSAEHDPLTGLPNRLLLNDRIRQAIALARRHMYQVAVMFLDLDGFKHVNTSLGHPLGDRLLQSVAERLVDCIREPDTVSRQGGDEFVLLLTEIEGPESAALVARRVLQTLAGAHRIDDHDLQITASIGVSVYPEDGTDAETLIKNADAAMYQAKENGRQSFQFFEPSMNARAVERQSVEESLQGALERNELALHYQPKIDLRTGAIIGAEALLRWTHPKLGPVSPGLFIPVAEDSGLILPIGDWVLREACRQSKAWLDAGLPATAVAVNVSATQFRDGNFPEYVLRILGEAGLDSQALEVELTESALMKRADSMSSILGELRASGIRISVDDFGTGYSSLSYLRRFPLDALKIDQSFVRQISAGDDPGIVTAVIGMAQSLKLRVIAEGVESPEEVTFLQDFGCDEAQGYYFSRPIPAAQFAKLLENTMGLSKLCLREAEARTY